MNAVNKLKRFVKPTIVRIVSPTHLPITKALITKALNVFGTYYCPVCESSLRRFVPYGDPKHANIKCPVCASIERHRLDWVFLTKQTDLFDKLNKKMLHIAPEKSLSARFRRIKNVDYLSADLRNQRAMAQMDITNINYPDNSFQVIYCSHVLEHIPDDRKALSELYRVICRDGWAVLQVPITAEKTYEDPAIIEPEDRKKHFGQWDHVRRCGLDYAERMRFAGFVTQVLRATDVVTEVDCARMGFQPDRLIFFCRKPL